MPGLLREVPWLDRARIRFRIGWTPEPSWHTRFMHMALMGKLEIRKGTGWSPGSDLTALRCQCPLSGGGTDLREVSQRQEVTFHFSQRSEHQSLLPELSGALEWSSNSLDFDDPGPWYWWVCVSLNLSVTCGWHLPWRLEEIIEVVHVYHAALLWLLLLSMLLLLLFLSPVP